MGKLTFITGGARCGKTSFALKRLRENPSPMLYLATGEPRDDEMRARIEAHRAERKGMGIDTIEEPLDIAKALVAADEKYSAVMLDCLTLWLSNLMGKALDVEAETARLMQTIGAMQGSLYVVSNEVGLGIVPDNALARAFRDHAGRLNAAMAEAAGQAWMLVSGLPLRLK